MVEIKNFVDPQPHRWHVLGRNGFAHTPAPGGSGWWVRLREKIAGALAHRRVRSVACSFFSIALPPKEYLYLLFIPRRWALAGQSRRVNGSPASPPMVTGCSWGRLGGFFGRIGGLLGSGSTVEKDGLCAEPSWGRPGAFLGRPGSPWRRPVLP